MASYLQEGDVVKKDLRFIVLHLFLVTLTACGNQRSSSGTFEKAADECLANVIPKSFVVKYLDGRSERVAADSKEEFISGFLKENLEQIEFAEHDFKVKTADVISPFAVQTGFADNWGVSRVNAQALWQQDVRGTGVIVAVVDTGMQMDHPQLRKQVATNAGELGLDSFGRDRSANGVDDDANGFIDDSAGWDFTVNSPLTKDYTGHGTHVAGVIAAAHTDTIAQAASYVQGMAPLAKILPLAFLDDSGSGSMLDGVLAIQYAVNRGAKVINASWGGASCSRSLKDTIAKLETQGVIFVSAAGNDGMNIDRTPMYPAALSLPAQIVVGATGERDFMAEYSNYGSIHVHLFAPGTDIVSTFPKGAMASLSGTSMATPFVAGAIALLLSAEPGANVAKIRQALYSSAFKRSEYLSASQGRMNLAQALAFLRQ
jgi:subtilisin family serine protease